MYPFSQISWMSLFSSSLLLHPTTISAVIIKNRSFFGLTPKEPWMHLMLSSFSWYSLSILRSLVLISAASGRLTTCPFLNCERLSTLNRVTMYFVSSLWWMAIQILWDPSLNTFAGIRANLIVAIVSKFRENTRTRFRQGKLLKSESFLVFF